MHNSGVHRGRHDMEFREMRKKKEKRNDEPDTHQREGQSRKS